MTDLTDQYIQAIDKDARWHLENPDRALSKEYQKGFVNGLIQAKYLIGEVRRAVRSGHGSPGEATEPVN